jgi:hypothetical protein
VFTALGARDAGATGAVGVVIGVCVNRSRDSATTSDHVSVDPYSVTLVLLTYSKSCCVDKSNRGIKQWSVASSLPAMDRLSCSTLNTKLAELSCNLGCKPKYLELS